MNEEDGGEFFFEVTSPIPYFAAATFFGDQVCLGVCGCVIREGGGGAAAERLFDCGVVAIAAAVRQGGNA